MKTLAIIAILLVLFLAAAIAYGRRSWDGETRALRARLQPQGAPLRTAPYDEREIAALPAPVQRYFRAVLKDGQPIITSAHFTPEGEMRTKESDPAWTPFSSDQVVVMQPVGFDWDARVRMAPGLTAHVHDAYVEGQGVLLAKMLGLVTVARLTGTKGMAEGELMRYLAEAVWYPTALLPGQGVTWVAVDDSTATATLADRGNAVSVDFRFDASGMVQSVYAAARQHSDAPGESRFLPWQGQFAEPVVHSGMRVPASGEVAWVFPDGPRPYWRGRIDHIAYQLAEPALAQR